MLSPIINEYTITRYNLLYNAIPHIAIPLSSISFSLWTPDEILTKLALKKKLKKPNTLTTETLDLLKQEAAEDVDLNIKVATIFRCNLLQLTNNARKARRVGLAAEIPYTNGTTLIINQVLFKKLKNLLLTTKLPHSKAQTLLFKENGSITALYNNQNFSYKVWVTKFKNRICTDFLKDTTLKDYYFDIHPLAKILNHLNNTKLRVSRAHFLEFKHTIEASDSYKCILQHHNCTKTTTLVHTILDNSLEMTSDETFTADALTTKSTNDYLEYKLIISQLTRILKYSTGDFFLKFVLDGRSRIYVYQWPINYQLNHFIRNIIEIVSQESLWSTYKKFLSSAEYVEHKNIYDLWKIKKINYTKMQQLLDTYKIPLSFADIAQSEPTCLKKLKNLLLAESLITVLASLAPSEYISLQERVNFTADWLNEQPDLDKHLLEKKRFVTNIFEKNDFTQIKKIKILKKLLTTGEINETWWADASSNALQLIVLTRGTDSKLLLQLLNLIENKTKHKNIYSYIAHELKKLDYAPLISKVDDAFLQLINLELAKYIAMPAAYGKTLWSCKKTIKKNLATKSTAWVTLSADTQDKLCSLWYFNTFKILNSLGLDLKNHISRCKTNYDATKPVYSHFKIPIFTRTSKVLNRSIILRKLKTKRAALCALLETTPSLKNYHTLADTQLKASLLEELNRPQLDEEATQAVQQALKFLNAIQIQQSALLKSDLSTRRVNVIVQKTTRIQFRLTRLNDKLLDLQRSATAIAPNVTHAYDAAILLSTIESLRQLNVPCMCIHDSIGCRLEHAPIIIYLYKFNLVKTVKEYYYQRSRYYPYTLDDPYQLASIEFPKELLNSTNLFY